jgi:hypothetical protein
MTLRLLIQFPTRESTPPLVHNGRFSPTKLNGNCEEIGNPFTAYGRRRNWIDAIRGCCGLSDGVEDERFVNRCVFEILVTNLLLFLSIIRRVSAAVSFVNHHRTSWRRC